ncbi:hypothetical protein AWJ20_4466 [Sugiyamaella lignohabitans]|uniref:Uncharacterized protein n=1 Tax=Sugiyamaella lignohabitans TaxID=796027 RepID=A0A167CG59_9ASCO|nr:uncharacterized protein AWJ20_4466 [Sugiyamaella lignohabitans]ANB11645.1 hypothetical protein AWJ20_4466 [Sugiyamaella lignohabitans]
MAGSDYDYIKDLLQYLVECPEKFNFKSSPAAATDLRRALFRAASVNGKYIGMFFPELSTDSQSIVDGNDDISDEMSRADDDGMGKWERDRKRRKSPERNWIMSDSSRDPANVDPSHPGRPCGRKFRKGEPTYRCL